MVIWWQSVIAAAQCIYLPTYTLAIQLFTYLPTTMDPKHKQRLCIIQKQMMMIVNLLVVAIAIICASDEEQLAWLRLPYHTSILTGEGWGRLGHGTACWAPTAHPY